MPREAGRTMGASFRDATERASPPVRRPVRAWPADSVSHCGDGGGGNAGSCSDHFNCGSAGGGGARARDTARSRRGARPAGGGGGAGGGGALRAGVRAPGCSPGTAARQGLLGSGPARARDPGVATRAPAVAQGFAAAAGSTPLFWGGRRRFRASCVTSVCTAALTSVGVSSRTAIGREPLGSSPHLNPPPRTGIPWLLSRKQGSAGRLPWLPG